MKKPLYKVLAAQVARYHRIRENPERFAVKAYEVELEIAALVKQHMPSGSGIDCGTTLPLILPLGEKLVFGCEFHHMDENGSYDGWTSHTIVVTPSLQFDFCIKIGGRDRNQIKEYLHDVYHAALCAEVES
jgi:hypothetical protein